MKEGARERFGPSSGGIDCLARFFLNDLLRRSAECVSADASRFIRVPAVPSFLPRLIRVPCGEGDGMVVIELARAAEREEFGGREFAAAGAIARCGDAVLAGLRRLERQRKENAAVRQEAQQRESHALIGRQAAGILAGMEPALSSAARLTGELLSESPGGDAASRYLAGMREGLRRIRKAVELYAPAPRESLRYVEISELIDGSLAVFPSSGQGTVNIRRELGPGLPRVPESGLGQVFVNIIKNALEAMPSGGELLIAARREQDSVVVSFTDTGTGIAPAAGERIFEPFFSTKGREGRGLGLAISSEIISGYGGRIEVESRPGEGSRFTVILPEKSIALNV